MKFDSGFSEVNGKLFLQTSMGLIAADKIESIYYQAKRRWFGIDSGAQVLVISMDSGDVVKFDDPEEIGIIENTFYRPETAPPVKITYYKESHESI